MGYSFHKKVEEGVVQNVRLQEGVNWNCDDNGYVWGIYKDAKCGLDIQRYGAYIEEQVIRHLQSNPFYNLSTIEVINAEEYLEKYNYNKLDEQNIKQSITFKTIKDELRLFYYENQYDEERYPHFRACDKHIENDMNGGEHIYYQYYD